MADRVSRRQLLGMGGALAAGALVGVKRGVAQERDRGRPPITLNASTIRPTPLERKIAVAAEAGYDGIELWIDELERLADGGGAVTDLGKRIGDLGLIVPNVIGLWDSMPQDDTAWKASLAVSRRRMELAAAAGARHVAAIPAPDRADIDVLWAAERYRALLALGREVGIGVAVEFVGFLKGIHRLGQAAAVAVESNDPSACIVLDTFHLYRGGSMFGGAKLLQGSTFAVCHFNDVPSSPTQFELSDSDRIMPGDGILPLVPLVRDLLAAGFRGPFSLEIFNKGYWERDPLETAREGLAKTRAVIDAARQA